MFCSQTKQKCQLENCLRWKNILTTQDNPSSELKLVRWPQRCREIVLITSTVCVKLCFMGSFFTIKKPKTKNSSHSGHDLSVWQTQVRTNIMPYSFISFSLSQGETEGNQTNKTEAKQQKTLTSRRQHWQKSSRKEFTKAHWILAHL